MDSASLRLIFGSGKFLGVFSLKYDYIGTTGDLVLGIISFSVFHFN